jgi:hypothetical protein
MTKLAHGCALAPQFHDAAYSREVIFNVVTPRTVFFFGTKEDDRGAGYL